MKNQLLEEAKFCLNVWKKQGFCTFGKKTTCENCASLYLLYKLLTQKILHGENMQRLTLYDWEKLIEEISLKK